jgi:hypothetical protein
MMQENNDGEERGEEKDSREMSEEEKQKEFELIKNRLTRSS